MIPGVGKTIDFVPTIGHAETATTGSDGRYSIDLSPGSYEVRLEGYGPTQLYFGRYPKTYGQWPHVTVIAAHETKLDLIYDSGIL